MSSSVPSFSTVAVHAGLSRNPPETNAISGVQATLPHGRIIPVETEGTSALEERIAALEGGTAAVALASGGAALRTLFHLLLRKGDEIVAPRQLDDPTAELLIETFDDFGWRVAWADIDDVDSFEAAIGPKTKAIFVEALASDGATLADLDAMAILAKRAGVPLIVDNSFATPFLCRPFTHRADLVVHTSLALLTGQAATGGLIVDGGTFDWAREGRYPTLGTARQELGGGTYADTYGNIAFAAAARSRGTRDFGPALAPADARAALAGIETLSLRLRRQSETAATVAEFLSNRSEIAWLRYPGIRGDRHYNLARRFLPAGGGPTMSMGLAGGPGATARFLSRLQLIGGGAMLTGAGRTRIDRLSPKAAKGEGVARSPTDALRLTVGLEEATDLLADLGNALAAD